MLLAVATTTVVRTAAAVLRAGRWQLHADRHRIHLLPLAGHSCPNCRGTGGRWTGGPFPEMEACTCWSNRRELHIRLLPPAGLPAEDPF
ncbi:hypothetical protein K3769_02995 [Streptomyces sp. A15ISP2-DRY2]|uniref:Uncharacterized protein n=2 Tax=Streptomyces ortus TaxID=2867268 RepID=A0ABT3UWP7_9ACTN|nr:hypothetical protein [Streptomyces ortus]MCX4231753.1 hypothetical protein [Streptomyces ortus]